MSSNTFWPRSVITDMIEQAITHGSAAATLPSDDDANRFRHAIHNYLRSEASLRERVAVRCIGDRVEVERKPTPAAIIIEAPAAPNEAA